MSRKGIDVVSEGENMNIKVEGEISQTARFQGISTRFERRKDTFSSSL